MSLDELITAANQLNETDLDQLLQQVVALRVQRKADVLPSGEAELLSRINQGVPAALRTQYESLQAKRKAEALTEAEHTELVELSQRIEQFGAERLKALIMLAQLRQVSLDELMNSLGIPPMTYE